MNIIEKSESIRAGLRKGFQNGTSKLAQRRCYGYNTGPDGELIINSDDIHCPLDLRALPQR
jgi:hypothetical protein